MIGRWTSTRWRTFGPRSAGTSRSSQRRSTEGTDRHSDAAAVDDTLALIGERLAPAVLPSEVVWFWQTWDPFGFDALPYPGLTDPAFALTSWTGNTSDLGFPSALFPVAYESHGFLFAELGTGAAGPAPIWYFAYADDVVELRHTSLAALFRSCAEAIEATGVIVPAGEGRDEAHLDLLGGPAFDAIRERHLAASVHRDRERRVRPDDVRSWPAGWRRMQGIDDADLVPLGRTHSVAELIAEAASGPVRGRLHGRWHVQAGGGLGGDGAIVAIGTLTDETGTIPLVLPGSVARVGGAVDRVEVDVTTQRPVGTLPEMGTTTITAAALRGELDAAAAEAAHLTRSLEAAVDELPVISRMVPLP